MQLVSYLNALSTRTNDWLDVTVIELNIAYNLQTVNAKYYEK